MDSKDRPELAMTHLPARRTMAQPALADLPNPAALAGTPQGSFNITKLMLRALAHHGWKMLAIWGILTAGLAFMIHVKVKPMYQAFSSLRVEPAARDLFGLGQDSAEVFNHFLLTQVELIKSQGVLNSALADPKVSGTSIMRDAIDQERELRQRLVVGVVPNTYLIKIEMTATRFDEAAEIVNAVVKSYLAVAQTYSKTKNENQITNLKEYHKELKDQIKEKKDDWILMAKSSDIETLVATPGSSQSTSSLPKSTPDQITVNSYKQVREQHFTVSMELIESEALLSSRKAELNFQASGVEPQAFVQKRIDEALRTDPELASMLVDIDKTSRRMNDMTHKTRFMSDPARAALKHTLDGLQARYRQLWARKRDELTARSREGTGVAQNDDIKELATQIEIMKSRKATYEELMKKFNLENREQETVAVKVALLREELESLQGMEDSVNKRVEQLRFDSRGEARISLIDAANTTRGILISDNRRKYWAITPVGVLAMVLGLFLLLEMRSGRISDLEEVTRRVPVEVYPLPSLPMPMKNSDQRALRTSEAQLEEFLQSLDHLRVSLWFGNEPTVGRGRCLAVTSAVGGEGKTTLTSHLAVCCAKAGISTLVIDADLRRAALSRMFEEEQNVGLSDVLKGDLMPEEPLIALTDAGFHLLPAGTPGQHPPSWLFREQRIGQVLDRYREMFDLIIIDTPPVLPVADALSLGRWVDGALLVIRYDLSRFALVDRARKRLLSAGIPILKTVVNGMKNSRFSQGYDSSYGGGNGGYGYGYGERTLAVIPPESSSGGDDPQVAVGTPPSRPE